ncbi:MAG: hypothetical protein M3R51_01150 [Candidatus Eremiobacteraeota bacterium]|nr:hypothetical protein [Candidatus Eremiobacteraeota bacterium]
MQAARLQSIIRGALDVVEPAFPVAAVRSRVLQRRRRIHARRSGAILAAGFIFASFAVFASEASAPHDGARVFVTGSTPAPTPVPEIT